MPASRCPSCDHSCKFVAPSGPSPCFSLWIGEKPGREEAARGVPFCGDTGQELNNLHLPLAGLDRREIRVSNAVKCRLGGNNDAPTPKQVRECAGYWLPGEIEMCQPEVVVLMGATACSLLGQGEVDLDKEHGVPRWQAEPTPLLPYTGWVVPMYHPAAALHSTGMLTQIMEDFTLLGRWLRGRHEFPVDEFAGREDYRLVESTGELEELAWDSDYLWLPVDTEDDSQGRPWSLQYSLRPGHGRMILGKDKGLVRGFFRLLRKRKGLLLHFANHDLDRLERMAEEAGVGELVRGVGYRDTLQEAYHLRNLPQGLKALGYRLFGVSMRDYMDVVGTWSKRRVLEWLAGVWAHEGQFPLVTETMYKRPLKRNGVVVDRKVVSKANEWEKRAKWMMDHSDSPTYDLWAKAREFGVADRYKTVDGIGELPGKGIEFVPLPEAVRYGCQDADVTGRVGRELERRRGEVVQEGGAWWVDEGDWDHREVA